MAEIIAAPSALSKIIPVSFKINDTDSVTTTRLATKKQFNTTDTDAWLSFTLEGIDTNMAGEYDLTMINVDENPSSIVNHTNIAFSGIPFHYKMDSSDDLTKNEIRHAGRWMGQVVVRLTNGDTTTRQFDFAITGHLLDGKEARLILIEDYNALMATITTSKDELSQYNIDYAALIETVTTQEAARVQAELTRAQTFDALVESEMVAQNVATKLTEKEATFAPRMLSVEQQLEQKADIADLPSSAYVFKGSTTFALLPTTLNTLGDVYYTTDNLVNYAWTGTAWTPIGNGAFANGTVTTAKIADKAITPETTSFFEHEDIFILTGAVPGALSSIGSISVSSNAKVSDYIPIDLLKDYELPFFSFGYAFYNANKITVDSTRYGYMIDNPVITDIPATTAYIRVCWYTNEALNPQYYTPDSAVQILDLSSNVLNMPDSIPFEALNFEIPPDRNIYFKWQSSYGLLTVYMKANEKDAYLEYNFQHLTGTQDVGDPTTWYDVWRMRTVYVNTLGNDGVFTRSHPSTLVHTGSEWECAIKESGQVDFIGGSTHGDEYVENLVFMLDGVSYTNPADFAALTCKELRIFRKGSLYRCNTMKGTKVADHYVDYLFKDNVLNINQKVKWIVSTTTDISYLTMLGIKRLDDTGVQITSKALKEGEAVIYDVSVDGFTNGAYSGLNDCKKGYLWNDSGVGLKTNVEVEVLDSNDFPLNNFKVDNRVDYNKMYFDHCGGGFSVASGDIWFNKARYKIDYLGKY